LDRKERDPGDPEATLDPCVAADDIAGEAIMDRLLEGVVGDVWKQAKMMWPYGIKTDSTW
jgi:hypothetical protein